MKKDNLTKVLAGLCICIAGVLFILGRSGVFSAETDTEGLVIRSGESRELAKVMQAGSEQEKDPGSEADTAQTGDIFVHVCGAVRNPEVYKLPAGARVSEAVSAAGGFTDEADTALLNLAGTLEDGMQIRVPTKAESASMENGSFAAQAGLVNINTAGSDELMTLPGIGSAKAAAIISYREKNGNFKTGEDIMNVPGIKQAAYELIRDRIRTA